MAVKYTDRVFAPKIPADLDTVNDVRTFAFRGGSMRKAALESINHRGDKGIESLLSLIQEEDFKRNLRYRGFGLLILIFGILTAFMGNKALQNSDFIPYAGMAVVGWLISGMSFVFSQLPTRLETAARTIMACLHETLTDPRAIGPLLDSCGQYKEADLNTWNRLALGKLMKVASKNDLTGLSPFRKDKIGFALKKDVLDLRDKLSMVVPEDREQFLLGAIHASELLELKDAENPLMHLCELPDGDPRQERIRSAAERALQAIKT